MVTDALSALQGPELVWSEPVRGLPGAPAFALLAPGTGAWLASADGVATLAWARERVQLLQQLEHLPVEQREQELVSWETERARRELGDPSTRLLFAEETLGVLHATLRACRTHGPDGQVDDVQPVCPLWRGRPGWEAPTNALPLHLEGLSVPLLYHLRRALMRAALGACERAVDLPRAWAAGGPGDR